MKLTDKELKTVISALEIAYGYPINELVSMDKIVAGIMRKLGGD